MKFTLIAAAAIALVGRAAIAHAEELAPNDPLLLRSQPIPALRPSFARLNGLASSHEAADRQAFNPAMYKAMSSSDGSSGSDQITASRPLRSGDTAPCAQAQSADHCIARAEPWRTAKKSKRG
jgi:hypothetical protein